MPPQGTDNVFRREKQAVSAIVRRGLSCRRKEQAGCRREEQTMLPPRGADCFGRREERAVLRREERDECRRKEQTILPWRGEGC